MVYNPPTKVTTLQIPYLALVVRADEEWARKKHREVEYEFDGKVFVGNPDIRGLYNRYSNTYTVGQPYGGLDTNITDNLAPTVGNAVPGIYSGIDDGKGWA